MTTEEVEIKKVKLNTEEIAKNDDSGAQTCLHYVKRKKRYCKMTVAKGKSYCGEHLPAAEATSENGQNRTDGDRIPCPLDAKHTVYKKNLYKHLKICNARARDDEPSYVQKGINAGDAAEENLEECENIKLNDLKNEEFYGIIEKVKKMYAQYVEGHITTLNVHHNSLDAELAKEDYGKESIKHLQQTAALLGLLDSEKVLQSNTSFIEFGAGKGQLAFYLAQILQQHENAHVVLLDRMSLRHKKDNKIEDRSLVHRIRVDIADFCMSQLDLLRKMQHIVAVSKHLCGAATDLTLRCITQKSNGDALPFTTDLIMIALCCHHRCEWRSFVGKKFFHQQHITQREFVIITKMVSWAICGTGMSRERRRALEEQSLSPNEIYEIHSAQRLPLVEREQVGFMCKRVIDFARLEYLREHGYEASLKYYVPRNVTLENVCLVARKIK